MSLDEWQALGIICGAILAALALLRLAVKGVGRMFKLVRKAGEFLDQVLGNKEEGRPSMMDLLQETRTTGKDNTARLVKIEAAQAEHLEQWHGDGNKVNGPLPIQRGRRR